MARSGRLLKACFASAALTRGVYCHAIDADQPTVGLAYNTRELSALQYECEPVTKDQLTCKFTQLAVRKKLAANDLVKRRKQLEDSVRTENLGKECAQMQELFDLYDGKQAPPESVKWKDPRDKQEAEESIRILKEVCATKDVSKLRELNERTLRQEMWTCRISANNFEQTFRRVHDPVTKSFAWVVDGEPEGACGIVQLSRFEPRKWETFTNWNYIARKAITNPNGTAFLGARCADLDEETYEYSWNSSDGLSWADCDKVEFSPF